jgi:2,3-bisphosphoglycerate-dependent phosphoglycerate mutase
MEKKIYVIRHGSAEGQSSEANLTEKGRLQANRLAEFFTDIKVDRIISSPFLRALKTIEPFAKTRKLAVQVDDRLSERVLSSENLPNWMDKLKETFENLDLVLEGGESSFTAMNRAAGVVHDILKSGDKTTLIVTHGNLMSLLLKYYNNEYGFVEWKRLTNPDVYLLTFNGSDVTIDRIWSE